VLTNVEVADGHGEYGIEVIAVRAARLYAWSRVGVGAALTVAPSMAVPSLAERGSLGAIRLVGVRDLALGVHALTVPGSGWRRTMLTDVARSVLDRTLAPGALDSRPGQNRS